MPRNPPSWSKFTAATHKTLIARRQRTLGPAYRHFYREPLPIVRGKGVWLFDADGRRYLDCYNNVPSVGHCHPRVVGALCRQAGTLNTHTRYLHAGIVDYAEKLTATFPGDLSVVMFCCTGSEANELACRIATAVSGREGILFTTHAYHGNSSLLSSLQSAPERSGRLASLAAAVEPPAANRSKFGAREAETCAASFDTAIARLNEHGVSPALFIVDTIFDAWGIQTPPAEYMQSAFRRAREAGALVVADEVQAGLCRLGDNYWGFEDYGVVPDIVTLGKPLGDGHPLAAVVTTPQIAEAFAATSHYFNTFGGNPVSAAVGRAVLEVIESESILERVRAIGAGLKAGLCELAERHQVIGGVRGKGLFLGVEIVSTDGERRPDSERALQLVEAMRADGVLLSTTGIHDNVLKFRPPLVFGRAHAEEAVEKLDHALAGLA